MERRRADRFPGRRSAPRQRRITEGFISPLRANDTPGSVSAETRMRFLQRSVQKPARPQQPPGHSHRRERHRVRPAAPLGDRGRQRVVPEESHGAASASSRSRTASAAYWSASRMSGGSRPGCASSIPASVIPPAVIPATAATGMHRLRLHGMPSICLGFAVILVNLMSLPFEWVFSGHPGQAPPGSCGREGTPGSVPPIRDGSPGH